MTKPIIKYCGGKRQLLDTLVPLLPENINTYYEPFAGGLALYFATEPNKAVLNDFNPQLMNVYNQLRNKPEMLLNQLTELENKHSEEFYLEIRKKFNDCLTNNILSLESAAYFIYLNKSGFNGLYRLNRSGLYNVPSGKKKKVNLGSKDNLYSAAELLQNATLLTGDFETACKDATKDDFVFFDPPYYNTFDTYQAGGFSEDDHKRLARLFKELTVKGVKCILTNSNEEFIKDLYKEFKITVVPVKRNINRDGTHRTGEEIIVMNY